MGNVRVRLSTGILTLVAASLGVPLLALAGVSSGTLKKITPKTGNTFNFEGQTTDKSTSTTLPWLQNSTSLFSSGPEVSIGTTGTFANLEVRGTIAPATTWPNSAAITLTGEGDGTYRPPMMAMRVAGSGNSAFVNLRSRGTLAAPTPIQNGDLMSIWSTKGYDGANWGDGVNFVTFASENWTTTAHGSYASIRTIPSGGTAMLDSLIFHSSGNIGVRNTTPAKRLSVEVPNAGNQDDGLLVSRDNGTTTFGFKLKSEGTGNYWGAITGKGNGLIEKELMAFVLDGTSTLGVGIGMTAPAPLSNTYMLNVVGDINSSTRLRVGGTQVCTSAGCTIASDARYKKDISTLDDSLAKVLRLKGIRYQWRDPARFRRGDQIGLIAQEVDKVFPEVVLTDKRDGMKSLSYGSLVAPIIEAIRGIRDKLGEYETQVRTALEARSSETAEAKIAAITQRHARLQRENVLLKERIQASRKLLDSFRSARLEPLEKSKGLK